jgi:hypothetical protein
MEPALNPDLWLDARVIAFWDRPKLTYENWLAAVLNSDSRADTLLKQSMLHMKCSSFVELIGSQAFIDHYPEWRNLLTDDNPRTWTKKCLLDALWSWRVCGTAYMKNPTQAWFSLTKKQKETFYCISEFGYGSIYQVAKRMDRNYRRVFDDVKKLIDLGIIQSRDKIINGRKTVIVGL